MCKKAKILLLVSGLFTLAMGLSNVFVNILLWKKSNDFIMIAKYNLMHYIFTPIVFIISGWISKKKNGIWPLRLGICGFMLFFIFILLVGDHIIKNIYPLGILFGISSGFYWLAFNLLCFDFTSINNRDTFNGFNGSIVAIANGIAPFIAASIIERGRNTGGYTMVFAISLVLFIILIWVSILLKSEDYGEKIIIKKLFSNNNEEWKILRKAYVIWGLRDVVIVFLISILIYKTTGSELSLGKISFFSYIIAALSCVIQQKIIKPKRRILSITIGAVAAFVAIIGLVIQIEYIYLLAYVLIDAIFMPFFTVPMSSVAFNSLTRNNEEKFRTEYIINKELVLNIGRMISTSILIVLLTFINHPRILNYFLLFLGSSQLLALYYFKKVKSLKAS